MDASLTLRALGALALAVGVGLWQLLEERAKLPWGFCGASRSGAVELLWPPSKQSAPLLLLLVGLFAMMVQRTFFNPAETVESRRVRETKRRLALAQMCQALRWNEDNPSDDPQKRAKRRPPLAADLFEMVYDDVEERHVLDYNHSVKATSEECRSFHQYYEATVVLFKERLIADFEECLNMTSLARREAHGEDISGCGLDNDDLKRVPEFADGSKLSDLLHLYQSKVRKVFGDLVESELLMRAKRCRCELAREQRKGLMALWPALRPVLPMYALAVALMVFDACNGTIVFHSTKALLDKVGTGEVTVETLGSTMLQT